MNGAIITLVFVLGFICGIYWPEDGLDWPKR